MEVNEDTSLSKGLDIAKDLTEQENIVLSLVAMGMTNPAIQTRSNIRKNMMKSCMRYIFSKLGIDDRTQAAIWAVQNGYSAISKPRNEFIPRCEKISHPAVMTAEDDY